MVGVTPHQASIAVGELTPLLWERSDLAWHVSAARELENFIVTPQGPVKFRGGMRFIDEVKTSASLGRLIRYVFSATQAYVLILGNQTIRFGADKGIVEVASVPVELDSGDGVPWPDTLLNDIDTAQSADVLYMVHHDYPPRELRRASHTSWTLPLFDFKDGPYYPENITATTLVASAGTGTVTVTASAVTGINNNQGFLSTDVGRHIRMKNGANWAWLVISVHLTTTTVTAIVQSGTAPTVANATWRLGLWSSTTGWPATVAIHQGRLAFGTNPLWSLPRVDLSRSGSLDFFSPSELVGGAVNDDHAVAVLIGSGEVNTIIGIRSLRDLLVRTAGTEFRISSGSINEPITPTNAQVLPISAHGSADVNSVEAFNAELFVQRDGRTLRNMTFTIENDGYRALDLSVRAPHIMRAGRGDVSGGVSALAWAQSPHGLIAAVRADGVMPMLTFLPDQEVYGWTRQRFGDNAALDPAIESIAAIPYGGVDQLWTLARLTIGGATKRYVCILEEPLGDDDPVEDAFYLDAGLTLDNTGALLTFGTLTPGAGATVADSVDVVFTASTGAFAAGHVGRKILYRHIDTANHPPYGRHKQWKHIVYATAWAEITAVDSASAVRCTIHQAFPSLAPIAAADWRLTVTSVSGLAHLDGESASVWGDGAPQAAQTVAAGAITLETEAATIHVGLPYRGRFDPVLADIGSRQGTRHSKKQRINSLAINLWRSVGGRVTVPESTAEELLPYRYSDDQLAAPIEPQSGFTAAIPVPGEWQENPALLIEQDIPGPMTIRGIVPFFEVSDK